MILSAQSIRRREIITPFHERSVQNGKSYGLSSAGYDIRIREGVITMPNEFLLASALEHFNIPNNILAVVHNKSSWARRGLTVQNTVFEPGWRGYPT
jgi:dCTP deaminase